MTARVHSLIGDAAAARVNYDSARVLIEQRLAASPYDQRLYSALGLALAGLGRHAEAIAAAKQALAIMPVHREAWKGLFGHEALARIYVAARDYESAMDELEIIVSRPALLEGPPLRLDPCWDPLRESPRFQDLVHASEAPLLAPEGSEVLGLPANRA
jgi:serine/threonine-protein kinase